MFSLSDLEAMVKWSIKCVACLFCLFFAFISLMVWRIMALPSNKVWLYERRRFPRRLRTWFYSVCVKTNIKYADIYSAHPIVTWKMCHHKIPEIVIQIFVAFSGGKKVNLYKLPGCRVAFAQRRHSILIMSMMRSREHPGDVCLTEEEGSWKLFHHICLRWKNLWKLFFTVDFCVVKWPQWGSHKQRWEMFSTVKSFLQKTFNLQLCTL